MASIKNMLPSLKNYPCVIIWKENLIMDLENLVKFCPCIVVSSNLCAYSKPRLDSKKENNDVKR